MGDKGGDAALVTAERDNPPQAATAPASDSTSGEVVKVKCAYGSDKLNHTEQINSDSSSHTPKKRKIKRKQQRQQFGVQQSQVPEQHDNLAVNRDEEPAASRDDNLTVIRGEEPAASRDEDSRDEDSSVNAEATQCDFDKKVWMPQLLKSLIAPLEGSKGLLPCGSGVDSPQASDWETDSTSSLITTDDTSATMGVGSKVEVRLSGENWYPAIFCLDGFDGTMFVHFSHLGDVERVPADRVRLLSGVTVPLKDEDSDGWSLTQYDYSEGSSESDDDSVVQDIERRDGPDLQNDEEDRRITRHQSAASASAKPDSAETKAQQGLRFHHMAKMLALCRVERSASSGVTHWQSGSQLPLCKTLQEFVGMVSAEEETEMFGSIVSRFNAAVSAMYPSKLHKTKRSKDVHFPKCQLLTPHNFTEGGLGKIMEVCGRDTYEEVVTLKPYMELFTKRTGRPMLVVMVPGLGNCQPDCLSAAELLINKCKRARNIKTLRAELVREVMVDLEDPASGMVEHFRQNMDYRVRRYKDFKFTFTHHDEKAEGFKEAYQLAKDDARRFYGGTGVKNNIWLDLHTMKVAPRVLGVQKVTLLRPDHTMHWGVNNKTGQPEEKYDLNEVGGVLVKPENPNHYWEVIESEKDEAHKHEVFLGLVNDNHFCLGMRADHVL